jgi:5'-nucleotidase
MKTRWIQFSAALAAFGLAADGCAEGGAPVAVLQAEALKSGRPVANCQDHDDEDDTPELRVQASKPVSWKKGGEKVPADRQVNVQILGINDFHGQLSPKTVASRPAGGAAVLASYLKAASAGLEDNTFIAHAGDFVGASPPNSALLQDEPSISFFNLLANDDCKFKNLDKPKCNLVGTLGNHEFDEGKAELLRLLQGGNHANGPFLDTNWKGARFPYVSANVVDEVTGKPILPPYVIKKLPSIPIAFIGAVLKDTPTIVTPTGVAGLKFLDEADAINSYIPELHAQGVHTIVVLIHQGLSQTSYEGPTSGTAKPPTGALLDIVSRLNDDIDVVVSGHTHQFTNAIIDNSHGVPILVTQAFSASTAYGDIDLVIDKKTNDVVSKTAQVVTTWGDAGPGLTPDPDVASLVARADAKVAPLVNVVVGTASASITRTQNAAGESALGDLIADSQRASVGASFGFMNPGGIRADLAAGTTTWGALFTIQPFGNTVVKLTLTGQQIYDLLNQQWGAPQPAGGRFLQISGLGYTWDSSVPEGGKRVTEVHDASGPISLTTTYQVAVNNFIAAGGDNFTVLTGGTNQQGGPVDLDALIAYIQGLPQPFNAALESRIVKK